MAIHIHIHKHIADKDILEDIFNQLSHLNSKTSQIMSALEDLQVQVEDLKQQATNLQTALDIEQQQIADLLDSNAAVVTDLNNQISALNDAIANGATADQLNALSSSISEATSQLATTKTDLEGTV